MTNNDSFSSTADPGTVFPTFVMRLSKTSSGLLNCPCNSSMASFDKVLSPIWLPENSLTCVFMGVSFDLVIFKHNNMRLSYLLLTSSILLEEQPQEVFQDDEYTVVYAGNEFTIDLLEKIDGVFKDVTIGDEVRFVVMPRAYDKVKYLMKLKDERIEISTFFDDILTLADVLQGLTAKKEPIKQT